MNDYGTARTHLSIVAVLLLMLLYCSVIAATAKVLGTEGGAKILSSCITPICSACCGL